MAKLKTVYRCSNCNYSTVKWTGQCSSCGEWNSFVEEVSSQSKNNIKIKSDSSNYLQAVEQFDVEESKRYITYDEELNRVLGGGIVPGSLILVGGEPGIGKSTLLLQLALSAKKLRLLYVSGEESASQIKLRAKRIGQPNPLLHLLTETEFSFIEDAIEKVNPQVIIIDSIQTIHKQDIESTPGSIPQIRECTNHLMHIAKKQNIAVFVVGHITKDGYIAGPKLLEHMVDTVLYFEGDRNYQFRILRTTKNRFGNTSELGIYEMLGGGLQPVNNPSEAFLGQHRESISGISIACTIEGNRPMMVEIQALVSPTQYGTAQRSSTGFDTRRLAMLIAVLEKRCGLKLGMHDVFVNITGGLKIVDPSVDLAVIAAISSSYFDLSIPFNHSFCGEVGLSGEIRPPALAEKRIIEADKMGYKKIVLSEHVEIETKKMNISLQRENTVMSMIRHLFQQN